ncbi:MAG: right-handed parallel beta-helix repeat-containing protein [Planctomycetota bacterium]
MLKNALLPILVLFIPSIALSATLYVPDDYALIQDAIDAATPGDTIVVHPGTYVENIRFSGKAIHLKSSGCATLTVIDGNSSGSVVTFANSEDRQSVLEGFTVTNGSGTTILYTPYGGGIRCVGSSPTIKGNIIRDNRAVDIWLLSGYGAGIYSSGGAPLITGNLIHDNVALESGGGILANASAEIVNNRIFSNMAHHGGGIQGSDTVRIAGNLIYDNIASDADGEGAGIDCDDSVTIDGNTICHNRTPVSTGAGILCTGTGVVITNTIVWGNTKINGYPAAQITGSPIVSYCDVEGGWAGTGNLNADPLFADEANFDFHLTYDSPCRDMADNASATTTEDFEADPRIAYGTVDIGADEFHTHLYVTGDFTPDGLIDGKFVGLPGTNPVGLFIGSGVLDPPMHTKWGDFHLEQPWILVVLTPIPQNGILVLPSRIPLSYPVPQDIPLQALIGLNSDSLTNLFVLEVR